MVSLETLRHSAAHVLAMALLRHSPKAKLAIGPSIENGFYYDVDGVKLTEESLKTLEKSMKKIIRENLPFKKEIITKRKARTLFSDNKYKLEMLNELPGDKITIYSVGKEFVDMCKGPHVKSTGEIKAIKLLKLAGAYWRGDEKNKMLTRIYGTAFNSKTELEDYLKQLEEALSRDHIKLGKKLELFAIDNMVGRGLPMLLPKGATIRRVLERFIVDEELKRGYKHVYTPFLGSKDLYTTSGHWQHYKDSMYHPIKIDGREYIIRPMTCPHHFRLFSAIPKSYKDLPYRIAELASQNRYERPGELHGLVRIRSFTLADAHIFCTLEQVEDEFRRVIELIQYVLKTLGFSDKEYWFRLSLRDEADKVKYAQDEDIWNKSEAILRNVMKTMKIKNLEIIKGHAAYYGPKIDVQMKNVYGKEDTIITNQLDFYLPTRFKPEYTDKDGQKKMPVVIHRSSIGCIERTIAFLIEKYAGAFPTWLAPVQVKLLNFTDRNLKYARKVEESLRAEGIRIEVDYEPNTIQKKVRNAELEKVPYILVVGDKEEKASTIAVRTRSKNKLDFGVKLDAFVKHVKKEIESRAIKP